MTYSTIIRKYCSKKIEETVPLPVSKWHHSTSIIEGCEVVSKEMPKKLFYKFSLSFRPLYLPSLPIQHFCWKKSTGDSCCTFYLHTFSLFLFGSLSGGTPESIRTPPFLRSPISFHSPTTSPPTAKSSASCLRQSKQLWSHPFDLGKSSFEIPCKIIPEC